MLRWLQPLSRGTPSHPPPLQRNQGRFQMTLPFPGDEPLEPTIFPTRQSSRSRRKAERKVGSGKKGTVDEEEYLLQSIVKMCSRLATVQGTRGNAKNKKKNKDPSEDRFPHFPTCSFVILFRRGGEASSAYASVHGRTSRRG